MRKCTECGLQYDNSEEMIYHLLEHLNPFGVESVLKFIFNILNKVNNK